MTSPVTPLPGEDAVLAAIDLVKRAGARDFQIGYLHDDVPVELAGWYAHARYQGARTIRLRHTSGGQNGAGGAGHVYQRRWVVRGHWRNQPWGPGRELRRPVWVIPHVKGPGGAPLLGGERVTVVSEPREQDRRVSDADQC